VLLLPTLVPLAILRIVAPEVIATIQPAPLESALHLRMSLTAERAIPSISFVPFPPLVLMAFVSLPTPADLVQFVQNLLTLLLLPRAPTIWFV